MKTLFFSDQDIRSAVAHVLTSMADGPRSVASAFAQKYLDEVKVIIESVSHLQSPRILDVGCGLGVTISAVKFLIPSSDCHVLDRFVEFSPDLNRQAGDFHAIVHRLNEANISVHQGLFTDDWQELSSRFDCVTSFDVIEHLYDPCSLLAFMESCLVSSGICLIGTPNQVHLFNRIRALFGRNTWEDFSYWISREPFFGHIRELTPNEMRLLPFDKLRYRSLSFSNWPLARLPRYMRIVLAPFLAPGSLSLYMVSKYSK